MERVRRLRYRAKYTGMKETDLLLGHFSDVHLSSLNDKDLADFEALLDAGDKLIYAWLTGNEQVPKRYDNKVFRLIKNFKN